MSHLPENFAEVGDAAASLANEAQTRAQEALRAGRDYAQQNPVPIVLAALLIGVAVGMLCGRREPKPKDAGQIARELVEDAFAQIADRLPGLKQFENGSTLRAHCADLGRKLRWW